MGFEVTYKYHERKNDSYDKDELKSLKKRWVILSRKFHWKN